MKYTKYLYATILGLCALFFTNAGQSQDLVNAENKYALDHKPIMLLMESSDCYNVKGKIRFVAHTLELIEGLVGLPEKTVGIFPLKNGGFELFSEVRNEDGNLMINRYMTSDFIEYSHSHTVLEIPYQETKNNINKWLGIKGLTRRPDTGEYLLLIYSRSSPGHGAHYFKSTDGIHWHHTNNWKSNYTDHDANGLTWSEQSGEYVSLQTTYQLWQKPYPDNIGDFRRRVFSLRTSKDGVKWEPDMNIGLNGPYRPIQDIIVPDTDDSPEIEFYRLKGFPYGDRYLGVMLVYAPSPQIVNPNQYPGQGFREGKNPRKHGPHLMVEWWICNNPADLDSWRRPYRDVDAVPRDIRPDHDEPVVYRNQHIWVCGKRVYGLPLYRLAGVYSQANSEFSTGTITMPDNPLVLNASAAWHGDKSDGRQRQAYIMVEILDASGRLVEGYEKEKCVLKDVNGLRLPLVWDGNDTRELAGKKVSLRFYLRDAYIYAISY